MISLGSCLNALCIHQCFFTLAFGNLNDSQSHVSSETHPVSSGLVITYSPEVNFSWPCGVLSNACEDWYLVQNSSRLLGRFLVLFFHASPSSLVLCPINSGHFNVPKPKLSPQLMDTSRSLLGLPLPALSSRNCLQAKSGGNYRAHPICFPSQRHHCATCGSILRLLLLLFFWSTFLVVYGGRVILEPITILGPEVEVPTKMFLLRKP